MAESLVARYWCHMCSQMVSPVMELEIKCPYCDGGFVEEMEGSNADIDPSDRAMSLWAPVLLGMVGGSSHRRRPRRIEEEDNQDRYREYEAVMSRRRRSSALLQLLHAIRERERNRLESSDTDGDTDRERDVTAVLVNRFNRRLGTSLGRGGSQESGNAGSGISLGDYFLGPGLDVLLEHLAESESNRHGTTPAKKEAVNAMPTVKIGETISCSVCLEDFVIGEGAKEMPCKHKFHTSCILPWLDMHSSCPVCRFQMPLDEPKNSNGSSGSGSSGSGSSGSGSGSASSNVTQNADPGLGSSNAESSNNGGNERRFSLPWPFNGLFSLPGSGSPSAPSGSSSSQQNSN